MGRLKSLLSEKKTAPLCLSVPWGVKFWEHQEAVLYYAETIGVKGIKVFGDTEDRRLLFEKLNGFCSLARERKLDVYIENHRNQPHDTVDHTLAVLHEVKSSNLKVIFDVYNSLELGEDLIEALKRYRPFIHHLHVKWGRRDKEGRFVPLPLRKARPDYMTVLKELSQAGIFYSLEETGTDLETIKDGLNCVRDIR